VPSERADTRLPFGLERVGSSFAKGNPMTDDARVLEAISSIRTEVAKLDSKIETVQTTINAELKPLSRLFAGNGRPSLEARLYHIEQEMDDSQKNTTWAFRTAVGAAISGVGCLLWNLLSKIS
jgi:hypothetical protein